MRLLRLLFDFHGRACRASLWVVVLFWFAALTIAVVAGTVMDSLDAGLRAGLWVSALGVVSAVAVGIRRLRDRNKSPLWLVLFYGAPIALLYLSVLLTEGTDPAAQPMIVSVLGYLWLALLLWGLVELGAIRGTVGPNPHGPDPVAPK